MLASRETRPQEAKRQNITCIRAASPWRPLQLSLLVDKGLVFSTPSLNRESNLPKMENCKTRLSPSSLRPVSFRYETTSGHTSTRFTTTLMRSGMDRSFVMLALSNAGLDAIQSQGSAPFKRFTTNCVMEIGSTLPSTDTVVRRSQRFSNRISNVGYSTSFARYPFPK